MNRQPALLPDNQSDLTAALPANRNGDSSTPDLLLRLTQAVEKQTRLLERFLCAHPELDQTGGGELVPLKDAARRSGRSVASWYRDRASGKIGPPQVKRGTRTYYRAADLQRWSELGFCDQATFTATEGRKRGP
jgi:hypothetical protein